MARCHPRRSTLRSTSSPALTGLTDANVVEARAQRNRQSNSLCRSVELSFHLGREFCCKIHLVIAENSDVPNVPLSQSSQLTCLSRASRYLLQQPLLNRPFPGIKTSSFDFVKNCLLLEETDPTTHKWMIIARDCRSYHLAPVCFMHETRWFVCGERQRASSELAHKRPAQQLGG